MRGRGQGASKDEMSGNGDTLRKIVKVIKVYCQTGTPLSSSGGTTQVLLWDSQLYLGEVGRWKRSVRSRRGDVVTYRLAFLVVTTLGTRRFCCFAQVRYEVAKALRSSAVVAGDRGDEFLSVWTGGDVIRGGYRTRLSERDARVSSTQQHRNPLSKTEVVAKRI